MQNKYDYPKLERLDTEIGRHYLDSNNHPVPSVTTILSGTSKSSAGIDQWRQRVGDEEADRVIKQSTDIGTAVHEAIEVYLNGDTENRANGFMNVSFNFVEGESLIMGLKDIAVSSGSACTSASLEPSYVLRALGRKDELAHSSIRFSFGRFTSEEDVNKTLDILGNVVDRLRELSPLWEMHLDGIDLDTVEWNMH